MQGLPGALLYLNVFRLTVVGSCVLLMLVGWLATIPWLFMLSLCVAGEELLETTYYIVVLRWGQRSGRIA